jgi:hypothetical protein
MSEFASSFADAWNTSARIFGDTIAIGQDPEADEYPCVIHAMDYSTEVVGGQPGRKAIFNATVVMRLIDWIEAGGHKGIHVNVGGAAGRVTNDPSVGYTSDTAELRIGPLV